MQIGVFAKIFQGTDPAQVLAACKVAGYESVQYNMSCSGLDALPASVGDDTAHRVAEASQSTGIAINAISATYNMIDPDKTRREQGRRAFTAIAEKAEAMGSSLVTVCTGSRDPHDKWRHHQSNADSQSWTDMCREFELVLEQAERHDIIIGVEPEHANVVSTARKAQDLLQSFGNERLRIVFDPANLIENRTPDTHPFILNEAIDLLGPAIALVHAKDRSADGKVAPAGLGIIDWSAVLHGLKETGFNGPLIAHGMSGREAPRVASFLKQMTRKY